MSLEPAASWVERNMEEDILVAPQLYKVPESGWLQWMADISGEPLIKEGTISGNIVVNAAPTFAQWVALRYALTGKPEPDPMCQAIDMDLYRSEAAAVRAEFESGTPLVIAPITSVEKFTTFWPVLICKGSGKYQVGAGSNGRAKTVREIEADDHGAAMARAAKWYDAVRKVEVSKRKEAVKKKTRSVPPLYLDLATAQIAYDTLLVNDAGGLLSLLNGAHGSYLVASTQWCYTDDMAPATAARFAIFSASGDERRVSLRPGEMPQLAQLEGWQGDGAEGYTWDNGTAIIIQDKQWQVSVKGQIRSALRIQGNSAEIRFLSTGKTKPKPVTTDIPSGFAPHVPEIVVAWAVWRTLKRGNPKKKRA